MSLLFENSNVVRQILNIGSTQNVPVVELSKQDFTVTTLILVCGSGIVSLIDSTGIVYDKKNVGDTTSVSQVVLNFDEIKRIVLPPKELELVRSSLNIFHPL